MALVSGVSYTKIGYGINLTKAQLWLSFDSVDFSCGGGREDWGVCCDVDIFMTQVRIPGRHKLLSNMYGNI